MFCWTRHWSRTKLMWLIFNIEFPRLIVSRKKSLYGFFFSNRYFIQKYPRQCPDAPGTTRASGYVNALTLNETRAAAPSWPLSVRAVTCGARRGGEKTVHVAFVCTQRWRTRRARKQRARLPLACLRCRYCYWICARNVSVLRLYTSALTRQRTFFGQKKKKWK